MSLSFISESHGPLPWVPACPKGYQGPWLAGSTPFYCSGDFGSAFLQEVVHEHYSIRYFIFRFLQKMVVHWKEDNRLRAQFALKHGFSYIRETESIWVKPHHFNLVWAPGKSAIATFQPGKEYRFLCILFHLPLLHQLLPTFPLEGVPMEKRTQPTEPHLNELMLDILNNPYSDHTGFFFFETRIREMLFSIFTRQPGIRKGPYSEDEIARVHLAESIILSDILVHFPIPKLARKVKMGEARLKEAFKDIIGMGIYERLKEARLQKARELVLTTDLRNKHIYRLVGFKSITGFIQAYRDRFHLSPMEYRKHHRPND